MGDKLIVYYSLSGNTKSFAERFKSAGYEVASVRYLSRLSRTFTLFTPTYNFGKVPAPVERFLVENSTYLQAVVSFGNRNWGDGFAKAGEKVSAQYGVPLLAKVEMRGNDKEYSYIEEELSGRFK